MGELCALCAPLCVSLVVFLLWVPFGLVVVGCVWHLWFVGDMSLVRCVVCLCVWMCRLCLCVVSGLSVMCFVFGIVRVHVLFVSVFFHGCCVVWGVDLM